ncbi:MAG: lipopolysaccharide kinase InaA family protein [Planctomycetota bacterium]
MTTSPGCAHELPAPPLAAGVVVRRGVPRSQFLLTEEVERAQTLDQHLVHASPDQRRAVLARVADAIARMHRLGFIHHDLYPRNMLVDEQHAIWLVDAWRGGPAPQLRGPAYDIGCLMLDGADLFTMAEQRALFARYFGARSLHARAATRLLEHAQRARSSLRERLVRKPNERRGRALQSPTWDIGALRVPR